MNVRNKDLLTILFQEVANVNAKIDMQDQNVTSVAKDIIFFHIVKNFIKLGLVDLDLVNQRDMLKSIIRIKVGKVCVMIFLTTTLPKPMLM